MSNFFSIMYESVFGLYNSEYFIIFDTLHDHGGYVRLGLTFIINPLILIGMFYLVWNYPYAKFYHWAFWLGIVFIITAGISMGISSNEIFLSNNQELNIALADPNSGYEEFADTLPIKYGLFNGLLSLALGFLYSLIFKQFSKIQMHLPF